MDHGGFGDWRLFQCVYQKRHGSLDRSKMMDANLNETMRLTSCLPNESDGTDQ